MSFLQLPHWLMIVGGILAMIGLIGLGLSRNKEIGSERSPPPDNEVKQKGRVQFEEEARQNDRDR